MIMLVNIVRIIKSLKKPKKVPFKFLVNKILQILILVVTFFIQV
jgi:hypothetical protein